MLGKFSQNIYVRRRREQLRRVASARTTIRATRKRPHVAKARRLERSLADIYDDKTSTWGDPGAIGSLHVMSNGTMDLAITSRPEH